MMDAVATAAQSEPQAAPRTGHALLAGLQGGMVGVLWMLAWMGIASKWQHGSFWAEENLFATAFYGGGAIQPGFAISTFSGLSLYLVVYSLLGAVFAVAWRTRFSRPTTIMAAIMLALIWYFVSFRWIWRSAIPLAYLLHSERPVVLGHVIFGAFLGRFQNYLPGFRGAQPAPPAAVMPPPATGEDRDAALATPAPAQSASPRDPA